MNTVIFKHWTCSIELAEYSGGNKAIKLIDTKFNDPDNLIAIASVNLPELCIDEIAIKDYGENEGMYNALLKADVITKAHRFLDSGYIEKIPVCYLKN